MPHNYLTLHDIDPDWETSGRWRVGKAESEAGGMILPVNDVFVHHTVSPDTGDVVADVAGPCDTDQHNFGKVSYSWMVHASTNSIIEVEGTHRGAHTINNARQSLNGVSFGIGVIGNFHPAATVPAFHAPTPEHVRLITECVRDYMIEPGRVQAGFGLWGHRDAPFATACCGDALYDLLPELRRLVYFGASQEDDAMTPEQSTAALMILTDLQKRALTPEQLDALVGPVDGLYAALNDRAAKIEADLLQFRAEVDGRLAGIEAAIRGIGH